MLSLMTGRLLISSALTVASLIGAAATATAAPIGAESGSTTEIVKPDGCPTTTEYGVSNSVGAFIRDANKTVWGQPGITLTVSASSGTSWSGTVGGSGSFGISAIVAAAKATINSSITQTKTTTVTLGGSWTVPSSQTLGWLALGSQGYNMNWTMGHYTGTCV